MSIREAIKRLERALADLSEHSDFDPEEAFRLESTVRNITEVLKYLRSLLRA